MQIVVNVDELQFKELVDGELKNLAPEKIQEMIYDGIREYLHNNPETIKNLFVDSSYRWREEPTSYLRQLVRENLKPDEFKDIQDEIIRTLRTNYDRILRDAVIDIMLRGVFGSENFEDSVRETLRSIRTEAENGY